MSHACDERAVNSYTISFKRRKRDEVPRSLFRNKLHFSTIFKERDFSVISHTSRHNVEEKDSFY